MGENFGGGAAIRDVINMSFTQKLQTSKEWNENSPGLVYYQLVTASFDVLWFETDSAVSGLYMSPSCYEYIYGIRLTQPPK